MTEDRRQRAEGIAGKAEGERLRRWEGFLKWEVGMRKGEG